MAMVSILWIVTLLLSLCIGITIGFDPTLYVVSEGHPATVCAVVRRGNIDRAVQFSIQALSSNGTASGMLIYVSICFHIYIKVTANIILAPFSWSIASRLHCSYIHPILPTTTTRSAYCSSMCQLHHYWWQLQSRICWSWWVLCDCFEQHRSC